jgi:hypothetical protein
MKAVKAANTEKQIKELMKSFLVTEYTLKFFEDVFTKQRHALLRIDLNGYSVGRADSIHRALNQLSAFGTSTMTKDLTYIAVFL